MSGALPDLDLPQVSTPLLGTVVAVQANFYQVQLDSGLGGTSDSNESFLDLKSPYSVATGRTHNIQLLCTRRTRLKKIGQRVMVGDRVLVEEPDWVDGRGAISDVLPRKTLLDRPPVANAEQILLVFALVDPPLDPYQLTRFLVKAESTGLDVCLC
ncbi:MAG: GTPase RsgA, partial [Microcoleus sp. SIO2G3]|nr:GTPase RsgA [Microcoleus sp. SIO2G3]